MNDDKNKRAPQNLWVHTRSPKPREGHRKRAEWDRVSLPIAPIPPVVLGRFNCRGDYVWPGMHDKDDGR